jgi:glycosyltransferase involved in cell wall biosynthesis
VTRKTTLTSGKPRIAVVSPFLDKLHGTERCVTEQVERLADHYEVHLYSTHVADLDLRKIVWHRIPALPGPHVFNYLWWFAANHLWRWWDRRFRGFTPDLIYSPGINCLDADLICVHIVFAEFHRRVREQLGLLRNPLGAWPRVIHRRLYYQVVKAIERLVYPRTSVRLAAVSRKVAADLAFSYGRTDRVTVIYNGWESGRFTPERRLSMRTQARGALGLAPACFALLLIGNDWKKKGLPCLLEALGKLHNPALRLMVVGRDIPNPYRAQLERLGLEDQVSFLPLRADVEFYYAAADIYVGPSLEDAFGLPPLEALISGLPVIVSSQTGVSELMTDGLDGFILEDPGDTQSLARMIDNLYRDPGLRESLGRNATRAASTYTWDHNAEQLRVLLEELLAGRGLARQEPQGQLACSARSRLDGT